MTKNNIIFNEIKEYTYLKGFAMGRRMPETLQALNFARKAHKNQYRRGGQAYIVHPLTMACQAIAIGIDDDKVIAAILLHDVLEDCGVSVWELPVSQETRDAVSLLTYHKPAKNDLTDSEYTLAVNDTKAQYYDALSKNRIASIAKIIDRCHNISTVAGAFTPEKLNEYIAETEAYVLPLIRTTKNQFPEVQNALFILKYHITSVLASIKGVLEMNK